jgi:hypothetical protein
MTNQSIEDISNGVPEGVATARTKPFPGDTRVAWKIWRKRDLGNLRRAAAAGELWAKEMIQLMAAARRANVGKACYCGCSFRLQRDIRAFAMLHLETDPRIGLMALCAECAGKSDAELQQVIRRGVQAWVSDDSDSRKHDTVGTRLLSLGPGSRRS